MFSLQKFVLDTIVKMIGNEPDYKVQEYSLGWYDKKVLTDDDMLLIQTKIEEKNTIVEEEIIDVPIIEEEYVELPTEEENAIEETTEEETTIEEETENEVSE